MKKLFLFFSLLIPAISFAQSYAIDWHKIAGGGGTSTGSTYQVTGTIGQPDASGAMSGGNFSLTGGFWSLINVVQMPGLPNLLIAPNGSVSVKIIWPDTGAYTLLQTTDLAGGTWVTNTSTVTTVSGTNSITITSPVGNLFFRLANP